jgi:glycosyltransferase involved in cell wall biosynthesis
MTMKVRVVNWKDEGMASIRHLNTVIHSIRQESGYTFFCSEEVTPIDLSTLNAIIEEGRGDLWHGCKRTASDLEQNNPLQFVIPCWMLNATSRASEGVNWRLSFHSLLIRNDIFQHLEGLSEEYTALEVSAFDFGYRLVRAGVFPVYTDRLNPSGINAPPISFSFQDQVIFYAHHFSKSWVAWASWRNARFNKVSAYTSIKSLIATRSIRKKAIARYLRPVLPTIPVTGRVSIVIITLDRYPYLRRLLPQLYKQTVPPLEIIIIDDTSIDKRDVEIARDFADLPLRIYYPDSNGQCSARNIGIQYTSGDYILFLDDDDDEVPANLIEHHLRNLTFLHAEVSCGEHDEVGAMPVNRNRSLRLSDVFPTINTMVRTSALKISGLFDERMDRGQSEDHDLGMRLYLSGSLMVIDPTLRVLHNRAPIGGLRQYKNRVITYSSSRMNLMHRRLRHVTELYLSLRYYSPHEVNELIRINKWATLSIHSNLIFKILKIFIGLFRMRETSKELSTRDGKAKLLIHEGPKIPTLNNN